MRRGAATLLLGLGLATLAAFGVVEFLDFLGILPSVDVASGFMASFASVGVGTVGVALAAGVAGVLAFESRAGAAVGVAISVTTIPAAAMAGVAAGLADWPQALGGLVLLGVNLAQPDRRWLRHAPRPTIHRPHEAHLMTDQLPTWNDTPTKTAIIDFVERVTSGADAIPPEERIAVFDNDGTLWAEKPMPIELVFILQRLGDMVEADASLRERQPWKAAHEKDYAWLAGAMEKHYAGDDSDVKVLLGGVVAAYAGMDVDAYVAAAAEFVRRGRHPTLDRTFAACAYLPMVELLRYLEAEQASPR